MPLQIMPEIRECYSCKTKYKDIHDSCPVCGSFVSYPYYKDDYELQTESY